MMVWCNLLENEVPNAYVSFSKSTNKESNLCKTKFQLYDLVSNLC